jgi:rod shape-determining protein MreC
MEIVNKRVLSYITIVSALFFILIGSRFVDFGGVKNLGSNLAYPFLIIQNKISGSINSIFERKKNYKDLVGELENYIKECESLRNENIALKSSLNFVEQTKELVEFSKQYNNLNFQIAQIIQKNFSENGQFFLVSLGSKAGIKLDMAVVYKNFLVGKITEAYPYWSKVLLVTDKFCRVSSIAVETGAKGICEGSGDLKKINLNFVSHLEKINLDNIIVSSGEGLIFPPGFSLGKIKDFRLSGLHYAISVEPEIDLSKINYCYILQRGDISESPEV